jgi:hypothetical protein
MRVTRDESPKNEKYFIREKGEAFDQFNALSHSVRAPPPSVRPSVNPIQLGANSLDETRNTQQMLLFIIIIVIMQYNDGRFKNEPPATIFIYQHTTLGVIPTPQHTPARQCIYCTKRDGRTSPPRPRTLKTVTTVLDLR